MTLSEGPTQKIDAKNAPRLIRCKAMTSGGHRCIKRRWHRWFRTTSHSALNERLRTVYIWGAPQ